MEKQGSTNEGDTDGLYRFSNPTKPAECPALMRLILKAGTFLNCLGMRTDGTYNRFISSWLELRVPPSQPKSGVLVSSKGVIIDPYAKTSARIFIPHHADRNSSVPLLFYFHGGGFACLSAEFFLYGMVCKRIAEKLRAVVVSANYRRTPEYKCPVQYEDCFSALRWAASEEGKSHLPSNTNMSSCILMGDSAGGNIVHHVGCMAALSKSKGEKELRELSVVGMVLIQPFFGGGKVTESEVKLEGALIVSRKNVEWCWNAFLPGDNEHGREHPCSNVVGPQAPWWLDDLQLPPIMVVVGGHDPLRDWQVNYVRKMKRKKKEVELVVYEAGIHVFRLFPFLKVTKTFFEDLAVFVERCSLQKCGRFFLAFQGW